MNCYKFEENITKFIDNELKQNNRKLFLDHKNSCNKCSQKLENINNNILKFNQLSEFKTSDKFMDGLNQKIYNYNNNPSIWNTILRFKLFETPPVYILGYAAALIICIFSSYSLFKIDKTNFNELNRNVTSSLFDKKSSNSTSYALIDEDNNIDQSHLADAKDNQKSNGYSKKQIQKPKIKNHSKFESIKQPIISVSNNNGKHQNFRKNIKLSNQFQSGIKSENHPSNYNKKEDYIIEYEEKNEYFKKRKDSLLKILNNNSDKKIISQIRQEIKEDSLKQLEYYRNFDKIQKNE